MPEREHKDDHGHEHHGHDHHDHDHHDHDHHGHHHPSPRSEAEIRTAAIESLLIEKGLVTSDAIDRLVERYENDTGPMTGARVVARAWVDPAYKLRLLTDSKSALAELGVQMGNLVVVENTERVHNAVVCTLCSCYPWAVLGLPPTWYKDFAYRSRMVIEPRDVLREFGVELDESVELHVWDSSAEQRYLVLPERPAGTEGMAEDELAALVSRDAMIGVARVAAPAAVR
jgi:nitrile hydratase subunit alpha